MTERRTTGFASALNRRKLTTSHTHGESAQKTPSTSQSTQSSSRQREFIKNPRVRDGKRKQPPDTESSARNSKRMITETDFPVVSNNQSKSGSHNPSSSISLPKSFRVSGIPLSWSHNDLFDALHANDPSLTGQNYQPSLYPACCSPTQIALVCFDPCTARIQQLSHQKVSESASNTILQIDSNFYNLTPLNTPKGDVAAELDNTNSRRSQMLMLTLWLL